MLLRCLCFQALSEDRARKINTHMHINAHKDIHRWLFILYIIEILKLCSYLQYQSHSQGPLLSSPTPSLCFPSSMVRILTSDYIKILTHLLSPTPPKVQLHNCYTQITKNIKSTQWEWRCTAPLRCIFSP